MMALIELEKEFTQYLEPLKQKVEDRFDELSSIVKRTTLSLSQWDTETELSVSTLHVARDEQVRKLSFSNNSTKSHTKNFRFWESFSQLQHIKRHYPN